MERRYFTTRKEHALHVIVIWCNSIVADIKTVGGLAATVFPMSITQSCLLSIDALSGLPFKISPELRVSTKREDDEEKSISVFPLSNDSCVGNQVRAVTV